MSVGAIFREVDLSGFGFKGVSHVGHGHSASAQLVEEIETGQIFVAKCVSLAALTQKDQALAHQEVFLLQELHHPLIVAYHDSFLIEGTNILVILMEYCEGGDLRKLITSKAELGEHFSEEEVMTWFVQILLALQYIHSEKVLHRDLKTSNIFLSTTSQMVKLGDFGISRVLEGTCDAAVTMVGTPYYMSPEVCRSEPYSWKSDVWALGCVLYELCMLKHAFESSSLMGLVYKIVSDHYDPIPSFYSAELNDLLRVLLSKSAASRPSVEELMHNPFVKTYLDQQIPLVAASSSKSLIAPRRERPSALDAATDSTASQSSFSAPGPETFALGPRARMLVLASRIRHRLVAGKLSWIAAFAAFDTSGDGVLSPENMQSALATLKLGLSQEEILSIVDSISSEGEGCSSSSVTLSSFEQRLVEANTSIEALQLGIWARKLLEPKTAELSAALAARDAAGAGTVPQADFQLALREVLPEVTAEQLDVLTLLADKLETGEVDSQRFVNEYASSASAPLAPWPSYLGAPPPPPPMPAVQEAEGGESFFTCNAPDFVS